MVAIAVSARAVIEPVKFGQEDVGIFLLTFVKYAILCVKKAPTPKWMLLIGIIYLSLRGANPVCRQDWHFFAYLNL